MDQPVETLQGFVIKLFELHSSCSTSRDSVSRLTILECAPVEEAVDAVAGNGLVVQTSGLQSQQRLQLRMQTEARQSCAD